MHEKLKKIISEFKSKKILIVGDIMLDKYIWGKVERISPEAPVPIVEVSKETRVPGGAANVANNIAAFDAKAHLIGLAGEDDARDELEEELKKRNISFNLIGDGRPTTKKVRVMGHNQQLLRVDYEIKSSISLETQKKIIEEIKSKIKEFDALIISDYAKGAITKDLVVSLIKLAKENKKIVFVDPKSKDPKTYENVDFITPNIKETEAFCNFMLSDDKDVILAGKQIVKQTNSNVLITRGEKGMAMFEKNGKSVFIPTKAREVIDVSGAGDTVIATFALAIVCGADSKDAMILANHAASVSISKVGTATVSRKELETDIESGE